MGALALTDEQMRSLRERYPFESDTRSIDEIARQRGWAQANLTYLQGELGRATAAMRDLMDMLGVRAVESPAQATDLIELACRVFTAPEGFTGSLRRESPTRLRIVAQPCPQFLALERKAWRGVTACASWHRRHGWYDALGVEAADTVEAESGWGDPACVAVVEVKALRRTVGAA